MMKEQAVGRAKPPSPRRERARQLYYVYADADEEYLHALEQHLHGLERQGLLQGWHRRKIVPGEDWQRTRDEKFEEADIVLFLVSPDLLDSKYACDDEIDRAMVRWTKGEVIVVPVIVRPVMWDLERFAECSPLPHDGSAISTSGDKDSAFLAVAEGIRGLLLGPPAPAPEEVAQRYLVRECVDRLEGLMSDLDRPSTEDHKNKLRGQIQSLSSFLHRQLAPQVGDVLAGRELLQPIGNGAFATVWLSKRPGPDDGERFATKVIHATCVTTSSMLWRFRRGVRTMRYLTKKEDRHPQIVPLLVEDDNSLAFTMPFLPGESLARVDRRGWSIETKVEVLISICRAVEYAHRRGVVHRDIKPNNILFDAAGAPVLTDFDLADKETDSTIRMDERGLGSPLFAAPEQLELGEKADVRFDVYSLGRLLHFLLLERAMNLDPAHRGDLDALSRFPMPLVSIVRRATQRIPAKRYPDVAALRAALEGYGRTASLLSAWINTVGGHLQRNVALLSVLLMALGASAFMVHASHDRVEAARNEGIKTDLLEKLSSFGEAYRQLSARFADLERGVGEEAVLKQSRLARLDALADEYARLSGPSDPNRDLRRKELADTWFLEQKEVNAMEAEEDRLLEKIRQEIEALKVKRAETERASLRHQIQPPAQPAFEVPPPPADDRETPFDGTALNNRLRLAVEQARARCRAPAGGSAVVTVSVVIGPTGRVVARMTSGPSGIEACVLPPFNAIRIEPPVQIGVFVARLRHSDYQRERAFTLTREPSP